MALPAELFSEFWSEDIAKDKIDIIDEKGRKGRLPCMNSDQFVMRNERAIGEFGLGFDNKHMITILY